MGTTQVRWGVVGSVSSHNSAQDLIDQGLWLQFQGEVRKLMEDRKYKSLCLMEGGW
jgi:hypothetical protein